MKHIKKLIGKHIYLSPKEVSDEAAEQYAEWLADFETTDYLGSSAKLFTVQQEKEFLEKLGKEEANFDIITLKDDKMIGAISLKEINHLHGTATVGIFIGDKAEREKGYGTEALRLLLDYGFNYLNLQNIFLSLMSFNDRALACYKKCGFLEIGRRRKCLYLDGNYYDKIFMDILKEEFTEKVIQNRNI